MTCGNIWFIAHFFFHITWDLWYYSLEEHPPFEGLLYYNSKLIDVFMGWTGGTTNLLGLIITILFSVVELKDQKTKKKQKQIIFIKIGKSEIHALLTFIYMMS